MGKMTRDEHLAAAKTRALKFLETPGQETQALAAILLDLTSFPGLMRHPDMPKLRKALIRRDPAEVRSVIEALR